MKFKLGFYEDESMIIDLTHGDIRTSFKFGYSPQDLQRTLKIIESISKSINDLNCNNQPERSKREDSQECEMRCSEHCGNTVREVQ
jgi:hypothetical protein